MVSAFSNPNMPPLMAPESESPGLFALAKSNMQDTMKDPAKSKVANAMMANSLAQMGKGFFTPALMQGSTPRFDMNGNPIG